jgi:hypothetical protein
VADTGLGEIKEVEETMEESIFNSKIEDLGSSMVESKKVEDS